MIDDIWCCYASKKYSSIFLLYMMWQLHDGEKISSEKLNQIIVTWAKSATDENLTQIISSFCSRVENGMCTFLLLTR